MRWTEEPLDESNSGAGRFNFGFVGEPPPELAAHIDRFADLHTRERQRKLQRHDVPGFRKPPKKDQQALFQSAGPRLHGGPLLAPTEEDGLSRRELRSPRPVLHAPARIQDVRRVERCLDPGHQLTFGGTHHGLHVRFLEDSDSVFTADRSAQS